jgi:hypothetical protein
MTAPPTTQSLEHLTTILKLRRPNPLQPRLTDHPVKISPSASRPKVISMKKIALVLAVLAFAPNAAQASFAIALVQGGSPIVHGHQGYRVNYDDAPGALAECNKMFHTNQCKIIAAGSSGCVALANTGPKGPATRWAAGQARRLDLADQAALANCQAQFPGRCRVVHHFCQE